MGDIEIFPNYTPTGTAAAHLLPDGHTFTPERQAVHDRIIESLLEGLTPSGDPTFYLVAGGSGSGKTTFLDSGRSGVPVGGNAAYINSDEIKLLLPENVDPATRPDGWAGASHDESAYLAHRLHVAAQERGLDHILDTTGDSGVGHMLNVIGEPRARGYKVRGVYVDVPTGVAVARMRKRAKETGRIVPEHVARSIHRAVARIFPEVAGQFDELDLYDTSSSPEVRMAHLEGGVLVIDDPARYSRFLAKGTRSG